MIAQLKLTKRLKRGDHVEIYGIYPDEIRLGPVHDRKGIDLKTSEHYMRNLFCSNLDTIYIRADGSIDPPNAPISIIGRLME